MYTNAQFALQTAIKIMPTDKQVTLEYVEETAERLCKSLDRMDKDEE